MNWGRANDIAQGAAQAEAFERGQIFIAFGFVRQLAPENIRCVAAEPGNDPRVKAFHTEGGTRITALIIAHQRQPLSQSSLFRGRSSVQ